MIGRIKEQQDLYRCLTSGKPEFLVLYGRRRVGKTYLIKEYFNNRFAFYSTGVAGGKTRQQLKAFTQSLRNSGCKIEKAPKDWFEAFNALRTFLSCEKVNRDPLSGKIVVFLDELPWMDTARSDFRSALEFFWNSWGSAQKDLMLIACGSASSWIIENLLGDRGGFYNRITRQIRLNPFTLSECEEYFRINGIVMTRQQIIECYMVFGGIPFYLSLLDKRLSLAQNINELCFNENGQLYYEYNHLYNALFKNAHKHLAIIETISGKKSGITRKELSGNNAIGDGSALTRALEELEQCGFIRKYRNYVKEKSGYYYQLIDPFTLFYLQFMKDHSVNSWLNFINTPGYYSWCGNAFETVCLLHVSEIKTALGVSGVESTEYSWKSRQIKNGAQIDLIIDRKDGVINLCEMKYKSGSFVIDSSYAQNLLNKLNVFHAETESKKSVHITLVTSNGLSHNEYSGLVQNEITADELFVRKNL